MAERQINIIINTKEFGEINKGVDGIVGAPTKSVEEALAVAKEFYSKLQPFLEEKGKPATIEGVKVGR